MACFAWRELRETIESLSQNGWCSSQYFNLALATSKSEALLLEPVFLAMYSYTFAFLIEGK
jgi:hypothetical protein